VVLATAAPREVAEAVAAELGCFDEVLASDPTHNLKGPAKRTALEERFGRGGFEYVGDSAADRAVWEGAGRASCVGLSRSQEEQVAQLAPLAESFPIERAGLRTWLSQLRVHQWVKNLLLFLPLIAAHRLAEPELFGRSILAFLAFSLCASAVYLGNDLLDLPDDRAHPLKRSRPLAAGLIPIWQGLLGIPLLLVGAFALTALGVPGAFVAMLGIYLAVNAGYSFFLKRIPIADVLVLALVYSLRVLAGGIVTGIAVSPWLIGSSLFFFLNLALLKRYADLRVLEGRVDPAPGRGYGADDAPLLLALGPASGFMGVVVLALYIQSDKVATLYREPAILWALIPLLLYWVSRIWLLAHRRIIRGDPVWYTARDPLSWAVALAAAVTFSAAASLQLG
jgi:4-hydroxybenzoate polyprenyltransferase